jgi:hypothetical protein
MYGSLKHFDWMLFETNLLKKRILIWRMRGFGALNDKKPK